MLAAITVVLSVVLDQLTKWLVTENLALYERADFIPNFMCLYHTRNEGAAFSMLSDSRWVFMLLSFVAIGVISYLLYKEYRRHTLLTLALSMVLGGGIGNMIDRLAYGYVVDFFCTEFVDFAIFNVADCFVTVGAVLLGVYIVFFESRVEKALKEKEKAAIPSEGGEDDE